MTYSHVIDSLWPQLAAMDLGLGAIHADAQRKLQSISLDELFAPRCIHDRQAALACVAGLHLLINDVNGAHKIAQDLATPEGSYWHAIVHRRDGDFWNAKYWLRKVGQHPVEERIGAKFTENQWTQLKSMGWSKSACWNGPAFVDIVENHGDSSARPFLMGIQQVEWTCVFEYCWAEAAL